MRTHCPACRNLLLDGADICISCGAMFSEGFTGYRGRPMLLLIGRWSAVSGWLGQALALAAGVLDPSQPELMVVVQIFVLGPIALLMLVLALRLRHSGLGMLAIVLIVQSCLSVWLVDLTTPVTRRVDWSVMGVSSAMLLLTAPFAYRFWQRPAPPADFLACRNCGYLLRGLVVPRCPECGMPFDPKRLSGPDPTPRR